MNNSVYIERITARAPRYDTRNFRIEILSPVHIGSGKEFNKELDFTSTQDHTLLYDLDRIFSDFADRPDFLNSIEKGAITSFLERSGKNPADYIRTEIPGSASASTLREFMTLGNGKPVVPGSSLKGAIRTALFAKLFQDNPLRREEYIRVLSDRNPGVKVESRYLATMQGGARPNYDLGRVLRVGDAEFHEQDLEVMNVRVLNLTSPDGSGYRYGWKELRGERKTLNDFERGTPISSIVLPPDVESGIFRISLNEMAFDHIDWKKNNRPVFDWTSLSRIMNDHAQKMIDYEKKFLLEVARPDHDIREIVRDLVDEVESHIQNGDGISWVQQVGWGTGWHSKTGLHITDREVLNALRRAPRMGSKGHPVFPKSRKIAPETESDGELPLFMMGWIKISEVRS